VTFRTTVVTAGIKGLVRFICKVDDEALRKVPREGPLIVVVNHINFLEIPVLYTHLHPRPMTAYAKVETWDNPLLAFLSNSWGAIPLRRGEADVEAIQKGLRALRDGSILFIAPEGTRSHTGHLLRGKPGTALLALRSGAPLLPIACYGGEKFQDNIKRLRRTDFYIVVGEPFYVQADGRKARREARQKIADEVMYQISALLPQDYRGCYADLSEATEHYLRFPDAACSNLLRARN